jgi:hypothetical protein
MLIRLKEVENAEELNAQLVSILAETIGKGGDPVVKMQWTMVAATAGANCLIDVIQETYKMRCPSDESFVSGGTTLSQLYNAHFD